MSDEITNAHRAESPCAELWEQGAINWEAIAKHTGKKVVDLQSRLTAAEKERDELKHIQEHGNPKLSVAIAELLGWSWDTKVPGAWHKDGEGWRHKLPSVPDMFTELKKDRDEAQAQLNLIKKHPAKCDDGLPELVDFVEMERIEQERDQLREELERANLINSRACDDWSHDDTKVKELLKPHLPGENVESDGYGFRGVIAVAELAAARFTALENALREAKEIMNYIDLIGGCGSDIHVKVREALQTLSNLNIK